ncbi:MAG: TetR/AcrR family transcriptional regulator [Candidatus Dormibacteraeota bacterium]|nr:TetR/AcrR family transcriptional regulator [Candidatus Dormibacteraeota bacterium]
MAGSENAPLSGRRAQAARNDQRILEAARAVFVADPSAPIAAVAEAAGVGISALYRRYPSKEELLRKICGDGLLRYVAEVEAALVDGRDAWTVFVAFMFRAVAADTSSLTARLAGTFAPTPELYAAAANAHRLQQRLVERTRAAGAIRPDVETDDVSLLLEQIATVMVGDARRTRELRQRYLTLVLDGFGARPGTPLPGRPPRWQEISGRWATSEVSPTSG